MKKDWDCTGDNVNGISKIAEIILISSRKGHVKQKIPGFVISWYSYIT